ncbi:ankyrin repeat-containing domain protein [Boletus reticuloceps]|uniref:Ankyrin repeat-containing domain protein n=1 Tax=Boletus reticuloceps TaxID=495285 RepID=A0A8I2YJ78_9AGAM|nr:ankyrin repeat-containing domain protein [Boletus reticuloceps]
MERSRKTFRKIAAASQRVVAIANDYADREDYPGVPRCHHQLEEDMRRISVACACVADILEPPPEQGPAIDVRIQDWLDTDEPQECLQTLSRMESVLQQDSFSWSRMSRMFQRGRGSTATQYKIKEAVDLFNSSKGCFHFLFSTEIWNNVRAIQKQQDTPQPRDHNVHGQSSPLRPRIPALAQTEIDLAVSSDLGVHQGGHNIVVQGFPADAEASPAITTVQETVHYQDRHAVSQRRREVKNDKQRKEEEKELEEILKWLDGLTCAEKHDVTLSLRQEDTCKWLFDTTQYKMWRDGESGSFWLRGKPGAGKSVLVSFVIDSLKNDPGRCKGEILTFFYCDFRNERSTNSAEVMRSILSQLLRHLRGHSVNLEIVLGDLIKAKEWGGGTLGNAKELAGITSRAASLLGQKPLVIVDALDECKDVRKLIQALMMIRDHVRLFVSSRPLHTIVDVLSDLPFVSMEDMADELSADIELHVTRELDARQRLRDLDPGFKMRIRSVLCEKADGMFRWVQCSIDTLDRCVTRKEVRNALDSLPKGLDETYERILFAIDMETPSGRLAQRALVWLVAAQRSMRVTEIMEALSINLKTRTLDPDIGPMHSGALLDACGSLVTYSEKTGVIILAHFSVKEYLVGEFTRTNLPAYYISLEQAHLLLAQSCMCYLSICLRHAQRPADASGSRTTGASSQSMVQLHPTGKSQALLDYALDDALDHFGHLGLTFKSALHDVTVLAEDIQRHSWVWDHVCIPGRWDRQEFWGKPRWPAAVHDLLLYILVAFASDSFMEAFLRRIPLKPKKGTNPLVYAAYFDKDEHARMLLSLGAGLNQRGWETVRYCQSLPIEVAFWNRHYAMVTLFVEEGSTVPSHIFTDSFFKRSLGQPFPSPIPSSIVRLLLQTDEFTETINKWPNMIALHTIKNSNHLLVFQNVAEQDLIEIIRRFTQVADEIFAPNLKEAFFRLAVTQGYFSAVRYLRTLGTSLPSDLLVRLRHYPGRWKTASMIRFLLENGADALVSTSSGDSVLHAILWAAIDASEDDILEAVKLIVDLGCNPLEADSHGNTPLRLGIERGYISVAQYLLTLGEPLPSDLFVKLNRVQSDWCTASMIHFLVENGVDPLVHTADGNSLFHIVLQSLYNDDKALEVVKVLVDHHCDPLEANSCGTTPVHIAVERGHISVARHLVTVGAYLPPDLPVTLRASGWGTAPMIQFLIEKRANVLARTSNGDSMLHIVLQSFYLSGHEALEVVKLLVSYGCDPLEANSCGITPLHIAVERNHISVARYLLAFRSDITLCHEFRMRPRMIRLLVENGVNVLSHSSNWANPNPNPVLHTTLQSIYSDAEALEAVKLLIGYNCDLLEANPLGDTFLHAVVERGYESVARYLLSLGIHHPRPDLLITLNHRSWSGCTARMMIPLLVENGVNVLVRTSDGETLLHIILSAMYGDSEALEAARILIDYGCDPLEANTHGKAPLHIAIEREYTSVARYLISLGASLPPDLLTTFNSWAAARMVPFLVENGVNLLAHTRGGYSALHVVLLSSGYNDSDETLEAVRVLVDHGCDPFEANGGNTPLHLAVERGYISVAQYFVSLGAPLPPDVLVTSSWFRDTARMIHFLVKNGVNVLARTRGGDSALHVVLQSSGNKDRDETLEAVRVLVAYGCDPFEATARGNTPLHVAVEQGHVSVARYLTSLGVPLPPDLLITSNHLSWFWVTARMVHFLVENGVNVLAYDSNGNSALHIVLQSLHDNDETLEAVKVLVAYGCDPFEANARGKTPLHIAVEQGHMSIARYLISLGVPLPPDLLITSNDLSWLWVTARMVHFLVENGVNVLAHDGNGNSALHIVLQSLYNHDEALEAAKVLVAYGCHPLEANARGTTPLGISVERGHISVAQYFVSLGVPLPPDLLVTLRRGWSCCSSTPMVRFLVENGVDVLAHANDGDSLLHVVLQCADVDDSILEVATLLVSLGCDPLGANSRGNTPLHLAVQHNHISAVRYLLALGAPLPPDLLVTLDRTRSHWSTAAMIRFLVENGVDVLVHADNGDSVLHGALRCLNWNSDILEVAEFLIGCGCDPLEANSRGETPLHIAAERCQCDVLASYLIAQGGSVLTKASNGDTVLHLATRVVYSYPFDEDADGRTLTTVEFFVGCGSDPAVLNDNGQTPLHNAVDLGRIKTIKYLLSLNSPLPFDILFTAIQSDQDSVCCHYIVQTLVTSGCDTQTPNAEGDTPLQVAIKKGRVDVVKYLLSVESVQNQSLEDLLSAAALAPAPVQSEMRRIMMLSDRRARSESPELHPAKRVKHS